MVHQGQSVLRTSGPSPQMVLEGAEHSFRVLGMVSASSGARLSPAERTKSCGNPEKQLENTWALSPGSRALPGPCRGAMYTALCPFGVCVHIHIHACIMYIHISTHTCACVHWQNRLSQPPGGARRCQAVHCRSVGSVSGYVWSPPSCSSCHRQLVCLLRVRACDGHSHILPFLLQNGETRTVPSAVHTAARALRYVRFKHVAHVNGRVNPGAADQPPGNTLLINQTTAALHAPTRGAGQAVVLHPVSPAPPCRSTRNGALPPWGPSEPIPVCRPQTHRVGQRWSFWNPVRYCCFCP